MDFDSLLDILGQFGRYQIFLMCLVCLVMLPSAFNNVGIVFIGGVPQHWCAAPELDRLNLTDEVIKNVTIPLEEKYGVTDYSSCKMYNRNYSDWNVQDVLQTVASVANDSNVVPCRSGWIYDRSVYTSTIVSEWDLVCDDRWLQATASSIYMAGILVGVLVTGIISDMVGRLPAYVGIMVIYVILGVAVAFSPNYITFMVIRFFIGCTAISLFTVGFVIVLEIVGPDYRVHAGIGTMYTWSIGYVMFAGLAYGIRDWYTLQLVTACPCVLMFLTLIFTPESARWLYGHKKTEKADKIVMKAAKWNKVQLPENLDITVYSEKKRYIWDLCRTRRMGLRSMNVCFNWFVNSLVYYGLALGSSNLGGNAFLNFAISGAVELPATIATHVALAYVGRRWPLCVSMFVGGAALLCTLAVPVDLNWVTITLSMIGKFCITASFVIIYVLTAEMYPTHVRTVGISAGSIFARVGGVAAPYIAQLSDVSKYIPLVLFGALSITAGLSALAFPETKGKKLPETLEDGENFGRKMRQQPDEKDSGIIEKGHINPTFESTRI